MNTDSTRNTILSTLPRELNSAWERVKSTTGYLSEREARFIMTAIALSPAHGSNVEIGSFKGRSTVGLASIARKYGLGNLVAIDPHSSPSTTDPDLKGQTTSYDDFMLHLERAGVTEQVEVHRDYSYNVAKHWNRPIRFLWIDGDHTYEGAKADVDLFKPFLAEGAIVAMHDVLGTFEGSLRVFVEELLGSDDFGPAGFSGSIGWAQYSPRKGNSLKYKLQRGLLSIPSSRLIPVARSGRQLQGWNKYVYKFWRPLAPHGDVNPARFARRVTL